MYVYIFTNRYTSRLIREKEPPREVQRELIQRRCSRRKELVCAESPEMIHPHNPTPPHERESKTMYDVCMRNSPSLPPRKNKSSLESLGVAPSATSRYELVRKHAGAPPRQV